jgi:hypothetical protein
MTYFRHDSAEIKQVLKCRNCSESCQHGRNERARHLSSVLLLLSRLSLLFQSHAAVIHVNCEQAGLLLCVLCAILQQG